MKQTVLLMLLLASGSTLAQTIDLAPDPTAALADALRASADLAAAARGDAKLASAAQRAQDALVAAATALKAQPLCRPLPIIDSTTFSLLVEALERGERSGTVPKDRLTTVLQRHLLTVAQLKTLLTWVPRTADRLSLVASGSRRLVDPENAGQLYELFPQKQDQRALADLLSQ